MRTGKTQTERMVSGYRIQPQATVAPDAPGILIVEEQAAVRELLGWILHLAGYRVAVCASRQAILTWWDNPGRPEGDDPPVLLLDLSLLSTREAAGFLRHLRERWREAGAALPQIIVLTTHPELPGALAPHEHVLLKPFRICDLLALIQQAVSAASRPEDRAWREADTPEQEAGSRFFPGEDAGSG